MNSIPTTWGGLLTSQELWTVVNGVSTVVIAAATWVGYRSLKFSRKALELEESRQKRAAAVIQNEKFEAIAADYDAICTAASTGRKQNLEGLDASAWKPEDVLIDAIIKVLNRLESWAMFIETGLADEDVLFETAAPAFCGMVSNLSALLRLHSKISPNIWKPIAWLDDRWKARLKSQTAAPHSMVAPIAVVQALGSTVSDEGNSLPGE
jgi:hypothetical protein